MYNSILYLTLALDGGGWLWPRVGRFTPGNDSLPIVQEAGWALASGLTDAGILAPTRTRSADAST